MSVQQERGDGPGARILNVFAWPVEVVFRLLDYPLAALQKLMGIKAMPYIFLLPNLAFFGIFVVLPLFINFAFSFTGGTQLFLSDRVYTGTEQYGFLLDCGSYLDPVTCREDRFWKGIFNTAVFVFFQVFFLVLFSLVTALILNRKIRARGFFRAVFFFPVLLSPVVVALIWKWILLRDGLLNAASSPCRSAATRSCSSCRPSGRCSGRSSSRSGPTWASTRSSCSRACRRSRPTSTRRRRWTARSKSERVFWRITLPLLWPNMIVVIVLALIRGVQVFDEVFVLTGGGPGTATQFIVQYIYVDRLYASQIQNFGLASAASVVLGVVLLGADARPALALREAAGPWLAQLLQ